VNRWTIGASAVMVSAVVLAGCGPNTSDNGTAPGFDSVAAQAARVSTCQSSMPLTRQIASNLSRPGASATLGNVSLALEKLSAATEDSLLQQRLQNLVDDIAVLRAAWSHHSERTTDVTDQLRGMVNGFARTCPGH